jgi:hypothetical protein
MMSLKIAGREGGRPGNSTEIVSTIPTIYGKPKNILQKCLTTENCDTKQ